MLDHKPSGCSEHSALRSNLNIAGLFAVVVVAVVVVSLVVAVADSLEVFDIFHNRHHLLIIFYNYMKYNEVFERCDQQ